MTYAELGEALRIEREKRHLSIDDAANALKIGARQLHALEDGNIDSLPHQAYTKGFIRSYASWLGISNEEIQQAFNSLGLSDNPGIASKNEAEEKENKKKKSFIVPIFLLLAAIGLYWGWEKGALDFLKQLNISNLGQNPPLQSAEEFLASKDEARRNKEQEKINEPVKARIAEEDNHFPAASSKMDDADNNIIREKEQTEIAQTPETPASEKRPEMDVSADNSANTNVTGQNKLIITATEECWVHSNADKTDTRQFSLRKGDTFALTFARSLELKLGNAGGVRLRYNGEDLPPPGQSGQVKVLSFPPRNPS